MSKTTSKISGKEFAIGKHINIGYGFLTVPSYAASMDCNIFQIFLSLPD